MKHISVPVRENGIDRDVIIVISDRNGINPWLFGVALCLWLTAIFEFIIWIAGK